MKTKLHTLGTFPDTPPYLFDSNIRMVNSQTLRMFWLADTNKQKKSVWCLLRPEVYMNPEVFMRNNNWVIEQHVCMRWRNISAVHIADAGLESGRKLNFVILITNCTAIRCFLVVSLHNKVSVSLKTSPEFVQNQTFEYLQVSGPLMVGSFSWRCTDQVALVAKRLLFFFKT